MYWPNEWVVRTILSGSAWFCFEDQVRECKMSVILKSLFSLGISPVAVVKCSLFFKDGERKNLAILALHLQFGMLSRFMNVQRSRVLIYLTT